MKDELLKMTANWLDAGFDSTKEIITEGMAPGVAKRVDEVIDIKVMKNLHKALTAFLKEMGEEGFELQDTKDYTDFLVRKMYSKSNW